MLFRSAIFHDFCEEIVEVFMDDFSVYGTSFDNFLYNLNKVLRCCEDTNLVLNWEKYHFMVNELLSDIKYLKEALKLTRPRLTLLKRCPIHGTSKVYVVFLVMLVSIGDLLKTFLRPLTNLLQKDVPFVFDDDCKEAFEVLKKALITAPIVQPPDWNLPF